MSSVNYIFVIQGNSLVRIPVETNEAKNKEAVIEETIENGRAVEAASEHVLETEKPKPRNKRNKTSRG